LLRLESPVIRILGKASSINVRKVLWACDEIGVAYVREDWGSGFRDTHSPDFLTLNPNALVPVVLIDGTTPLWESNTILRYLASCHDRTDLLPAEPAPRAQVEKWMDWQATEFNNAWRYAFQALVRKNPAFTNPAELQASVRDWSRHVGILDAVLRSSPYVAGAAFTLADIPIGLAVNRWFATAIPDRPAFPAVSAYFERLSTRPAFMDHGRNGLP
jgi:glutathione S-transferase